MTPVYKVVMKHTEGVLYDFIRFDYRVRHPMAKMHLIVMGIGFFVIGILLRESIVPMLAFCLFGLMWFAILIFRQKIAFAKLSSQDEDYIKQTPTEFIFGQSEVQIKNPSWEKDEHVRYSEINTIYEDENNYYVCRNNEELYLLPFNCFELGDKTEFKAFLEGKTDKKWIPTKLPFRERLRRMNEARKISEKLHDENVKDKKK